MHAEIVASHIVVGVVPVMCFLGALFYLDSYKLVKLGWVVAIVVCGTVAAGASYLLNAAILDFVKMDLTNYSRYIAPVTEEFAKALIIVALIYAHRIGFLVDAYPELVKREHAAELVLDPVERGGVVALEAKHDRRGRVRSWRVVDAARRGRARLLVPRRRAT